MLGQRIKLPGLAPRPPPPVPQASALPVASKTSAFPAASEATQASALPEATSAVSAASEETCKIPSLNTPVETPACPNCIQRQRTLVAAFEQLQAAKQQVKAAIILGKEAVERSNARIGAYESLYTIYKSHGMPFEHGDRLPKEFMRDYPRHKYVDAIR